MIVGRSYHSNERRNNMEYITENCVSDEEKQANAYVIRCYKKTVNLSKKIEEKGASINECRE